jgi:ureidoglycolate dehydrogenase (NAD+)
VTSETRVLPDRLESFCIEAARRCGLREEDARITAKVLTTTDTWGVHTHGTRQLRPLMKTVRQRRLNADAAPEMVAEGPAWAIVDGHYAMPMVTSSQSMEIAIRKARAAGLAYVGVKHSSHFGAAGYYAVMAAQAGMIGLSMCNVDPCVVVPGGRGKIIGTNPIAYAVPAGQERPVWLDIATSTAAATKVLAAKASRKPIPDTWLTDDDGMPTIDPGGFPERGALLPMAGHKGYGLAVLVEVLCGALTGAGMLSQVVSWISDSPELTNQGHAFVAIDVGAMMPIEQFKERMDRMIREIRSAPKAKGSERIYLPGEMEWERRDKALAEGMVLPDHVVMNLAGLAEDVGLDLKSTLGL